jgi:hypothetical protein
MWFARHYPGGQRRNAPEMIVRADPIVIGSDRERPGAGESRRRVLTRNESATIDGYSCEADRPARFTNALQSWAFSAARRARSCWIAPREVAEGGARTERNRRRPADARCA